MINKTKKKIKKESTKKVVTTAKKVGGRREEGVQAMLGNKWYLNRTRHGRKRMFESAEILLEAVNEYFEDVDNNPIMEPKLVYERGKAKTFYVPRKRPYTINGLCRFLGVGRVYFTSFKKRDLNDDYRRVIEYMEDTIYEQKFEGAAAGLFNANIISRDLGLIDKVDNTHSIVQDKKNVSDLFPKELD